MQYEPRGVFCKLERYEVEFGILVAKKRTHENRKRKHIYDSYAHLEPQPIAELKGVCAEMAVAKVLNQYWGSLAWNEDEHETYKTQVADVGVSNRIEVRRIRQPHTDMTFYQKDIDGRKDLYLACCGKVNPSMPTPVWVDVIGWNSVDNLLPFAQKVSASRWSISQQYLLPVEAAKTST